MSPCRYSTILCLDLLRAAEFLQVLNSRSSESCCTGDIKTCQDVEIDSDLLGSSQSLSILNISLAFCSRVPPNGFVYKTDLGDEAVMTVNTRSGNVFGSFKTQDGRSFGIERCHNKHVLKEFDLESFDHEEVVYPENWSNNPVTDSGQSDNSTLVQYTVMFYYTTDFAKITADIAGYIDQVLAETNQGYVNSDVPLRASKYCIEPAGISDLSDTITMLNTFTVMKEQLG